MTDPTRVRRSPLRIATSAALLALGFAIVSGPWDGAHAVAASKIAFASDRAGGVFQVWMINGDGSSPVQLTTAGDSFSPTFSPDGSKLAFATNRDSGGGQSEDTEIYVMNSDGSNQTRLTNNPARDRDPSWLGNDRILFASSRDNPSSPNDEIYVMNADGTLPTRLTHDSASDSSPSASSSKIFYSSDLGATAGEIFSMNLDGSGRTKLTSDGGSSPEVSPSGTEFAYYAGQFNKIYAANADGSNNHAIGPSTASDPAWSADGTEVVYSALPDNTQPLDLFVMKTDGSGQVRLTSDPATDEEPTVFGTPAVTGSTPTTLVAATAASTSSSTTTTTTTAVGASIVRTGAASGPVAAVGLGLIALGALMAAAALGDALRPRASRGSHFRN